MVFFVCGTAGYGAWVRERDYKALLETAVKTSSGRVAVYAGVLEPSTDRALERIALAKSIGVDHVVVIPPYYMGINDSLPHFRKCAEGYGGKIIVYNIPGCTGVNLTRKDISTLIDEGLVSAVKDSSGDFELFKTLCTLPVPVFQGLKPVMKDLKALGAAGCVPVPGNPYPELFVKAWHEKESPVEESKIQEKIDLIWGALVKGIDFMRPTAALMARLGIGDGTLLTGLTPLTERETDSLSDLCKTVLNK
jgi:4-hydroxy-tetrahydrodipicolinate synthase